MTRGAPIPETVTLHVPFRVVKRGGRKEMQMPEGATQPRRTDSTLVKALARAFRWKRMLESGEFATIAELAEREGIARAGEVAIFASASETFSQRNINCSIAESLARFAPVAEAAAALPGMP